MYLSAAAHAKAGRELFEKFSPGPGARLLIILGTLHTPRHTWLTEGIKEVVPKEFHVIGGAGADFGGIHFGGKRIPNAALGVMISGEFKVGVSGEKGAKDTPSQLRGHFTRAWGQIRGGKPRLVLYFGCASWYSRKREEQHAVVKQMFKQIPVFGQFAGGEIGRWSKDGKVQGTTDTCVVAIVSSE